MKKKKKTITPDGVTVEQPIMFDSAAGSGNPLPLSGSYVGRASHLGSLYAVKEALNSILIMLFKFACHG